MYKKHKKIKVIAVTICLVAFTFLAAKVIKALLTDTEISTNNAVSSTSIDLTVGDSNPTVFAFNFDNMLPNEERIVHSSVENTGGLAGNFWFEVIPHDSSEGENFESESNISGEGELDDCTELKVIFYDQTDRALSQLEYTTITDLAAAYNEEVNTTIDGLINSNKTKFDVLVKTNNCGNEAMGDTFLLDFVFHLDQI